MGLGLSPQTGFSTKDVLLSIVFHFVTISCMCLVFISVFIYYKIRFLSCGCVALWINKKLFR